MFKLEYFEPFGVGGGEWLAIADFDNLEETFAGHWQCKNEDDASGDGKYRYRIVENRTIWEES